MAIIKCENCGGKVSDKAKACPHCGMVLEQNEAPSFENRPSPSIEPKCGGGKKKREIKIPKKTILTIAGSVLLIYVAIITFGYFRFGVISANPKHWGKLIGAQRGDAWEQYYLGLNFLDGNASDILVYVPQDYDKGMKWLRLAAEHEGDYGAELAQNDLGLCYSRGLGVTQDDDEAVKWFRMAAEQGLADAQINLGWCYQEGRGVTQNYTKAVIWYRLAADQEDSPDRFIAKNNLGYCYQYGFGVNQDYSEAVKLYLDAAEGHIRRAQFHLGECFEHGYGVSQDINEAIKWYQKAADNGDDEAQVALKRLTY